jgi:hypothetical protein
MTETNEPDLEFIKSSGIGKVMAQALGNMYRAKPKFPIDYLAKWLDNYCQQRSFENKLDEHDAKEKVQAAEYYSTQEDKQQQEYAEAQRKELEANTINELYTQIEDADDHEKLIPTLLPQEIFKRGDLTGVYIGYYSAVRSAVHDDQVDADEPREGAQYVLQYIGGDEESMVDFDDQETPEREGSSGRGRRDL